MGLEVFSTTSCLLLLAQRCYVSIPTYKTSHPRTVTLILSAWEPQILYHQNFIRLNCGKSSKLCYCIFRNPMPNITTNLKFSCKTSLLKRNVGYVSCHILDTIADGGPLMQLYYFALNTEPRVCIEKPLEL